MSGYMEYQACVSCKGVAIEDNAYRIRESVTTCFRCGATVTVRLLKDEEGQLVLDEDGTFVKEMEYEKGYGTYRLMGETSGASGCFTEPITKETIEKFESHIKQAGLKLEDSFVASWDADTEEQKLLLGESIPDDARLDFEVWDKLMNEAVDIEVDELKEEYSRDMVLGWLKEGQRIGYFQGYKEDTIDFDTLTDEELKSYYNKWITPGFRV